MEQVFWLTRDFGRERGVIAEYTKRSGIGTSMSSKALRWVGVGSGDDRR